MIDVKTNISFLQIFIPSSSSFVLQGTSSPKSARKTTRVGAKAGSRTDKQASILLTTSKTSSNESPRVNKCEERRKAVCGRKTRRLLIYFQTLFSLLVRLLDCRGRMTEKRSCGWFKKRKERTTWWDIDACHRLTLGWRLTAGFPGEEEDHRE